MESVEVTKDLEGNITGIKLLVEDNPQLAQEVYKLLRTLKNANDIRRSIRNKAISQEVKPTEPLTFSTFSNLIDEAKASGQISKEEFLIQNPIWRKERLSSQS
ncbi:MAG: hypothetical protein MRZ79_23120 [Bacteroidia bacterium]|nr:hypothetical protein [Bacteroidia bacterium]